MKTVCALALYLLVTGAVLAQTSPDDLLTEAIRDCARWEEGYLHIGEQAVIEADLTGDGAPETLVDTRYLECSATPASPYCGSGGCSLFAFVEDRVFDWQAQGWQVIDWQSEPVLIIGRDGGWCGVSSAGSCFEALNWNGETFLTVMPPAE